jgi:asparagine synthase (glutamine-hydrolysing)
MRRALSGIVPTEILERKRKAFVARGPLVALRAARDANRSTLNAPVAAELGLVDQSHFKAAVELTVRGENVNWMPAIMRTIHVELWLQATLTNAGCSNPLETVLHREEGATKIRRTPVTA